MRGALAITDAAALGGGVQMGGNRRELFVNFGPSLNNAQRLMFTGGQLRQKLEFAFPSGVTRADMTQNSAGASWRLNLGNGLLDYAEANGYAARTAMGLTLPLSTAPMHRYRLTCKWIAGSIDRCSR